MAIEGVTDISPLAKLENLTELYIHSGGYVDYSKLSGIKKLSKISLSRETPVRDLRSFANFPQLKSINVSLGDRSSLAGLEKLTGLEELMLYPVTYYNRYTVRDLNDLLVLPNLKRLQISVVDEADLTPLKKMENLEEVILWPLMRLDKDMVEDLRHHVKVTQYW